MGLLGWWLISPLFIDKRVDEELPMRKKTAISALSEKVNENRKTDFIEMMNETAKKDDMMKQDMPHADKGVVLLAAGSLKPVAHDGSGSVRILRLDPYEDQIVRFENLDVLNGPDLHVYLSANENIESAKDVGDFIDLGKLKGNQGNQNYTVPSNVDATKFKSVVIFCEPFKVVFASANIEVVPEQKVVPTSSENSTNEQKKTNVVSAADLVGGWNVEKSTVLGFASITLDNDGNYFSHLNDRPFDEGTWKLADNFLVLQSSVPDMSESLALIKFENGKLTMSGAVADETILKKIN